MVATLGALNGLTVGAHTISIGNLHCMANKRRCNQCRDYFPAEGMVRVGSVWVCSDECRNAKLGQVSTERAQRDRARKAEIDKGPIREAVAKRDGNGCLLCGRGTPDALDLHRVTYGSEGGRYVITNCVLICSHPCHHDVVHGNKRVWQSLLQAHLAGVKNSRSALRRQLALAKSSQASRT